MKGDETIEISTPDGKTTGPIPVKEFTKRVARGLKGLAMQKNFKPMSDDTPPPRPTLYVKAKLITGGDPNAIFQIPHDEEFEDLGMNFIESEKAKEIGEALINERRSQLKGINVVYLFKRKGAVKQGRASLGHAKKPSGLLGYFCEARAVVILSANHIRDLKLTNYQLEALIYHELLHFEIDEGEVVRRGHDFEAFGIEVQTYGLWKPDLELAGKSFTQLPLL